MSCAQVLTTAANRLKSACSVFDGDALLDSGINTVVFRCESSEKADEMRVDLERFQEAAAIFVTPSGDQKIKPSRKIAKFL